jgi:exopolyphosphatase/guanosine-5'-triphosphate,3'-diphosphate pyrophosphatase
MPDQDSKPSPIRALIVDLGTNSFHAVIVDAYANGSFVLLDRRKERVELGASGLSRRWLDDEAIERAMSALRRIKILSEGWGVEDHLAYATSAIREARNGGDVIDRIRREIGLRVRTISGESEALLVYEGVRTAVDMPEPALIVDIGGGSTEFLIATSERSFFEASLKVGAARLTEQFVDDDPVSTGSLARLRTFLAEELDPIMSMTHGYDVKTMVGSSGAMQNLAAIALRRSGDAERTIFQQEVSRSDLQAVARHLIGSTRAERGRLDGLDEKRIEQIVAAAILVDLLLDRTSIDRFVVSPNALREGMVVHFIRQNHERLEQLAPFGDVRRRSINELGFRCQWEVKHAQKVASLAVQIFDACAELHGLGRVERELLEYAALLHDVGYHISRSSHHKHSQYIISNSELTGFQPHEIATMAFVARYHAGSLPKKSHHQFRSLDKKVRRTIVKLAAMLRLAEGLDRSHFQNVSRLEIHLDEDRLRISLETQSDPELDLWGARRGGDLFEKVYGIPVEIGLTHSAESTV